MSDLNSVASIPSRKCKELLMVHFYETRSHNIQDALNSTGFLYESIVPFKNKIECRLKLFDCIDDGSGHLIDMASDSLKP